MHLPGGQDSAAGVLAMNLAWLPFKKLIIVAVSPQEA